MNAPLLFEPIVKNNVWGGDFLRSRSENAPTGPVGESWEIADHGIDTTLVSFGSYAGSSLHEIFRRVCGQAIDPSSPEVFPLLLKIIDPKDDLSVQVHPDDAYAGKQKAGELGKTEAWYVLKAEPGAKIYRGLIPGTTKEQFAQAIIDGTCEKLLKAVPVKAGDVIYLPHGTIHALCAGVRIAEIQQNSDTTYRVYDYNRKGLDGKPRALHVQDALAVSNFSPQTEPDLCVPQVLPTVCCLHERYAYCDKFAFEKLSNFTDTVRLDTHGKGFHIITVVSGELRITTAGGSVERRSYDTCMIPAPAGPYTINASHDAAALFFYRPV